MNTNIKRKKRRRKHPTLDSVTLIKKNETNCPDCLRRLGEKKILLQMFEDSSKQNLSEKVGIIVLRCVDCNKYYINNDHIEILKEMGYHGRYIIKNLSPKVKTNNIPTSKEKAIQPKQKCYQKGYHPIYKRPKEKEYVPSCSNCMLGRSERCTNLKGLCDDYRPTRNWDVFETYGMKRSK